MKNNNLTEDNITKLLFKLGLPMIIGLLSISMISIVDTYFISFLGTNELAAMGFILPVISIIHSIYFGVGVGCASVISRAIGKGNWNYVQRLTTDALILAFIMVAIFTLFGVYTIEPTFKLVGANESTLPYIKDYMTVWYLGTLFLVFPIIGNNALRASGNTIMPSLIMLLAFLLNAILDPIFIFGLHNIPAMQIKGAAVATLIARMGTFALSIYFLKFKANMLTFEKFKISEILNSWKNILHVGIPAISSNMINPIVIAYITSIVSTHGVIAIAALGVATRIEAFIVMIFAALATVVVPLVGQNLGSNKYIRIREVLRKSFIFCSILGILSAFVLIIFGKNILSLFKINESILNTAYLYFEIVAISYALIGVSMVCNSAFNAMGMPIKAMMITFTRTLILIPLAIILNHFFGITGIFLSIAISIIITGVSFYTIINKICIGDECALK